MHYARTPMALMAMDAMRHWLSPAFIVARRDRQHNSTNRNA
jgi:hypothetical protein